jgi:signal transduction histidine kinase
MTLSLNVLNHLGINLYSSVPAVLSEAVANSWDADATKVDIEIDEDDKEISIEDNGHGMNEEQVNKRYLHVGYRRRKDDNQGALSPEYNREVMGRKGRVESL